MITVKCIPDRYIGNDYHILENGEKPALTNGGIKNNVIKNFFQIHHNISV